MKGVLDERHLINQSSRGCHSATIGRTRGAQAFNLIRYFGGQHSIFISPKTLETYYTNAKPNWVIVESGVSPHYKPYKERNKPSVAAKPAGS